MANWSNLKTTISNIVKSKRITFKDLLGSYQYAKMMNIEYDIKDVSEEDKQKILDLYNEIDLVNKRELSKIDITQMDYDQKKHHFILLNHNSDKQREYFLSQINLDINQVVNILVKELHGKINQESLWRMFGHVIFTNLETNLSNTKICECCKERFDYNPNCKNLPKYCSDCASDIKNEQNKEYYHQKKLKQY